MSNKTTVIGGTAEFSGPDDGDAENRVDMSMGPEILQLWSSLNFKPQFALAEFVDNSISSWQQCRDKDPNFPALKVKIKISASGNDLKGPFIQITDNAGGITDAEMRDRALRIGAAPENKDNLNQYGAGMKIAACWFSKEWEIRTQSNREEYEKHLVWNTSELMKNGLSLNWKTEEADYHGTEVTLWNPRTLFKGQGQNTLKEHLAKIYRHFIRDGSLTLIVESDANSYTLKAPDIAIMDKPFWPSVGKRPEVDAHSRVWKRVFTESIGTNEEGSSIDVHGWIGIRERGSTSEAGLTVYWKNRGVKGMNHDGGWKPFEVFGGGNSYEYQRLTGEIHITGIKKPPTTDDLLLHVNGINVEDQLIELINTMLEDPELPMRKQIKNYRKNADTNPDENKVSETLPGALGGIPKISGEPFVDLIPKIVDVPPTIPVPEALPDPLIPGSVTGNSFQFTWLGKSWNVSVEHLSDDPSRLFVEAAMSGDDLSEGKIQIRLNISHPFMTQQVGEDVDSLQSLTRLAIAVGLVTAVAKHDPHTRDPQLLKRIDMILRELAN
ncbi:ATP-binding protein [Planctomycetota bacterium]|nr:ATP-binding protein [Planctomycetota bacterium]